jgi:hypothetical protein
VQRLERRGKRRQPRGEQEVPAGCAHQLRSG